MTVYVPCVTEGFTPAKVEDVYFGGFVCRILRNDEELPIRSEDVYPAEEDESADYDDACSLLFLNEATLLNNIKVRFALNKIYHYVGSMLIATNPYSKMPDLYDQEKKMLYKGKSLGSLPPHIFAIADKAYREMRRLKQSQSLIVTGESGAGKTETQKFVLSYLSTIYGDGGSTPGSVEQRLSESNVLLESFGNAKTSRNNNSSRFGKFIQVYFGQGKVVGGVVSHYLLEKTRVCHQQPVVERNYHVFYQIISGADHALKAKLRLASPENFNYLRACPQFFGPEKVDLSDPMLDDGVDFQRLARALLDIGFSEEERTAIFECVAGILHLGNIKFDDKEGKALISSDSHLFAAELLQLNPDTLKIALTTRQMQVKRSNRRFGTQYELNLNSAEATNNVNSIAKLVYTALFDEIIHRINRNIQTPESEHFIGILDIAGFESFAVNSFEQLCINYSNEKLHNFFTTKFLHQEQELYRQEGLTLPPIDYVDNTDCIDLFERAGGLFDLLDEQKKVPAGSSEKFTTSLHDKGHNRVRLPFKSIQHRAIPAEKGFIVQHYAGDICYQTTGFMEKNASQKKDVLQELLVTSENNFIRSLFGRGDSRNKVESVSLNFRRQLSHLIQKLSNTGVHFVRCVKPNMMLKPGLFDGALVLAQLRCAGMPAVLRLMHEGYPSRTAFNALYAAYQPRLPAQLARLDPRHFCKCLFRAVGLKATDYEFGTTRVFFRSGKFAEFDRLLLQEDANQMEHLIEQAKSSLNRLRWRKVQYGVLACIKMLHFIEWIQSRHLMTAIKAEEPAPDDQLLKTYNLKKLREIVSNSSEDLQLIKRCELEIDRRQQSYMRWKANLKNRRRA